MNTIIKLIKQPLSYCHHCLYKQYCFFILYLSQNFPINYSVFNENFHLVNSFLVRKLNNDVYFIWNVFFFYFVIGFSCSLSSYLFVIYLKIERLTLILEYFFLFASRTD